MTQPSVSVTSDGMLRIDIVASITTLAAPTLAELNAGTSTPLTCYLTDQGWQPSTSEETAVDPRLCSRATFEKRGRYQDSLTVVYVYNPKSPANDEARLALPAGTTAYLVARWGDDFEDAWAASDIVDVIPFEAGIQQKQPPTANTPLTITQKLFITSPGVYRDAVVAP